MSQRSPYNDRYKTDQKGKTRKSASAAKPKRSIADLTPSGSKGGSGKKKRSFWDRLRSPEPGSAAPVLVTTPEMKRLRKTWWVLIGVALVSIAIVSVPQLGIAKYALVGWVLYVAAMSGALYLEFGPLRKARLAAIAAAKSDAKGSKSKRAGKTGAQKTGASEDTDE